MFRSRPFLVRIVLVSLFLFTNIGIVNSQSDDENSTDTTPIIVSSKSYTESLILGKIMALLLQEAGYNVDDQTGYPSADARDALERGEIHVYPEMAGTALALYHNLPTDALPTEGDRSHALAKQLDESQGIIWLTPTGYVLTTALVVRPDLWEAGLRTYSDLAAYMSDTEPNLRLCMIDIILERPRDGLKALEEAYGFQFPIENVLALPVTENLPALRAGQCDVATSTSTDGRISSWGYHSLEDDKAFYPLYVPAPTIRQQIIAENPEVADILSSFGQYLDLATIHSLNARVDIGADGVADSGDEETPEAVALSFLRSIGLLETPPIVVSSKSYSESLILGKIMALLLREAGYNVDDQTGYPSAEARDALERGEIHIYPEMAGTALALYHNLPTDALPTEGARSHTLAKELDSSKGIVWLPPTDYVLTTALVIRPDLWDAGLRTYSDLAAYMSETEPNLRICMMDILLERPRDGLKALEEAYGFQFPPENVLALPVDENLSALRAGQCDVATATSTDGRIAVWDYQSLEDDKAFYPLYVPAPTIRQQTLAENPEVADVLSGFGQYLDLATILSLNARVDIGADGVADSGDEETPDAVALSFLRSVGLIETPPIVVSSKSYSESLILGKIMALLLREAGYNVDDQTGYPSAEARDALEQGEIHIYPEMAGTALALYHNLPTDALPTEGFRSHALAKQLDLANNIIWLPPTDYVLTTALVIRPDLWDAGLRTYSDLAAYMSETEPNLRICMMDILLERPRDGLKALEEAYGFQFPPENVLALPVDENLSALRAGQCDVATATSTDGRIAVWDYHSLEDDKAFYPLYVPAPTIRQQTLAENPEVADVLSGFGQYLDLATILSLNARVDIGADGVADSGDEETPEAVALSFLRSAGLIETPPIVVSSKDYTEQYILSHMLILLLEEAGYNVEDKTGLPGNEIRAAMENEEIDLYMEFSGTALSLYHNLPTSTLPTDRDRSHRLARSLDESKGISWLQRSDHINSFAMAASEELTEQNIATLDDLADYMATNDANLRLCAADLFYTREQDGLTGLQEVYDFTFDEANIAVVTYDGAYDGLRDGSCDVAVGGLTNGRLDAWNLTVLQDTQGFFPIYVAAPVIRQKVLSVHPEVADLLSSLSQTLSEGVMIELNARVDLGSDGIFGSGDEEEVEDVAQEFLESAGLLDSIEQPVDNLDVRLPVLTDADNQ